MSEIELIKNTSIKLDLLKSRMEEYDNDIRWLEANKLSASGVDELKDLMWQGTLHNNDIKMFEKTSALFFLSRYSKTADFNDSIINWVFDIFLSYFKLKNYNVLYDFLTNILEESIELKQY